MTQQPRQGNRAMTADAAGSGEKTGETIDERSCYLAAGDGSIYCSIFAPGRPLTRRTWAVVLLGPLAEEKKSSLRPLVEMARSFAAAGLTAVRVDFRGTGDASGRSEDVSLASMIEDAASAVRLAREDLGAQRVALLGLRLGGAVAVLAAARAEPRAMADALVLIQPVVRGEAYVRELSRQQAIRRMLTSGSGGKANSCEKARAQGEREEPFDLDGLALAREFIDELGRIDLTRAAVDLRSEDLRGERARAALVLQVGARAKSSRELTVLGEALGDRARTEAVVAQPFWLQTDYVDPASATARVLPFLEELLKSGPGGLNVGDANADSE